MKHEAENMLASCDRGGRELFCSSLNFSRLRGNEIIYRLSYSKTEKEMNHRCFEIIVGKLVSVRGKEESQVWNTGTSEWY